MRFRRFKAITYFLLNKHVTMSVRPLNMLSMILIFNQRLCSFSYPLFIPVSRPVHYAALENFISNFVIVVGASNANQRLCTSYSLSTKRLGQVRVKIEGLSLPKYSLIDIIFLFVPYSRCSRHATWPGYFQTLKTRFERNASLLLSPVFKM